MTETEVQYTLRDWFRQHGYSVSENVSFEDGSKIDLWAKSESEEWLVEIKGDYDRRAAQYIVNFDTGMGQVLKNISRIDNRVKYAIAIPFSRTERGEKLSYRRILPKYSRSLAFEALNIHFLLVRDNQEVEIVMPTKVRDFLSLLAVQVSR